MERIQENMNRLLEKLDRTPRVAGAVFRLEFRDGTRVWSASCGEMHPESPWYIASINKLFLSALVLRAVRDGRISLEETLTGVCPGEIPEGLHRYRGVDYTGRITLRHLLSMTSGLPCYLSDRPAGKRSGMKELEQGLDRSWSTGEVLERVLSLPAHFPPGAPGRARYGDTGHQLLNLVIRKLENRPVPEVLTELFRELEMNDTRVIRDPEDRNYVLPRYRREIRDVGKYLSSTENDIVSTAGDLARFLRAFFQGAFWPAGDLHSLMDWKNIFFPFRYGLGIQQFYTPRILSPFGRVPDFTGHCGSTGSLAFFIEELDLFVTGTVNQQDYPQLAFRTAIRLLEGFR